MTKTVVSYIKNALIIGMALAFLWFFSNIGRYGSHYIQEPNMPILICEVSLFISVLAFGIYGFVKDIKGGNNEGRN